jgi:2-polyprenyl-3-methyl-5-hydroxy-6-metoxy-1,4-benzoquinol methylase
LTGVKRLAEGYQFDMVSILNIIDRTPRSATLLKAAHSMLSPDGLLLIATPLLFRPFYFTADHKITAVTDKRKPEKYGKLLETFNLSTVQTTAGSYKLKFLSLRYYPVWVLNRLLLHGYRT